jgi:hypothetical protein
LFLHQRGVAAGSPCAADNSRRKPRRRGPRAIFNEIVETLFVVVYAAFGMTRRKTRIRAV